MDPDDASIFDTAVTVVARYGMKRTTMADLARACGVSRQTLYDRFGDKDGIMAAVIDHVSEVCCRDLRSAFAERTDLIEKLDAYLRIAVWPIYETIQMMPDAADFEKGMGPASIAASRNAADAKQAILTDMLAGYLPAGTERPEKVAAFIEQSSGRAKMSGIPRDQLEIFLCVLKSSVVALAREA